MFKITEVPFRLKIAQDILALGTETRLKISFTRGGRLFSLEPEGSVGGLPDFYEHAISFLRKKNGFSPSVITFDPHPLFCCFSQAQEFKNIFFKNARLAPVFHHLAHVARFGLEKGSRTKFIGVAFDGTGYGVDKKAWGSEFFVYDRKKFIRRAHFDYMALPGSDAAINEPWRIALAMVVKAFGPARGYDFLKNVRKEKIKIVRQMLAKKFNVAYSSGAGRLFDAFASIIGVKDAVALEEKAKKANGAVTAFSFDINKGDSGILCVDFIPTLSEVLSSGRTFLKDKIARMFHKTVAEASCRVLRILKKEHGIKDVFLSGGVFSNDILCSDMRKILKEDGFNLFFDKRPLNTDLGISEGQIAAVCMGNICA
ncbi:MAG TPA: hypothetical protein PLU24_02475 [Candidatus Omnitrophota bacterium]|nr:hypothetical protein [Candidatus Omnitrophota bacterium]